MPRRCLALAAFAALALVASSASAQRPDNATTSESAKSGWLERPWIVAAQLGGGSPLGTAGLVVEHTPVSWATLSAGIGLLQGKPQFALIPRVHQPITDTLGIGFGAGLSFGPTGYDGRDALRRVVCSSCGDVGERTYSFAWWANGELSLEERRPWGLVWRVFVGGARVLNPGNGACDAGNCSDHPIVAYAGAAVGWSFSL